MNVRDLTEIQNSVIDLFCRDHIHPSGLLALQQINGALDPRHGLADLGDVIPFLLYFQRFDLTKELVVKALEKAGNRGLLVSETPFYGIGSLIKSYEQTDYILGLLEYVRIVQDQRVKDATLKIINSLEETFRFSSNWTSFAHSTFGFHLPLRDFRDGMFIELFIEAGNIYQDSKFYDLAQCLADQLLISRFWLRHGIWPAYEAQGVGRIWNRHKLNYAELEKANSNSLFGLIALQQIRPSVQISNAISRTMNAMEAHFSTAEGEVFNQWSPHTSGTQSSVTAAFNLIELYCDLYYTTRAPEYLKAAEKIAGFWCATQSKIGLFPVARDSQRSFIDSNTDMIIALHKLSELTQDGQWAKHADLCLHGMITYFLPQGFPLYVNVETGQTDSGIQKSKFIILFLKPVILYEKLIQGTKIYQDLELFNLLRDR
jgi:uncharacterized protein YyaL (SSP411 family)